MNFLEKLYSQEYFAPVLFTTIAILAVIFVIVLILAIRDAKKANKKMENDADAFALNNENPTEVNVPTEENKVETINEVKEEVKTDDVVSSVEPVNNTFEDVKIEIPEVNVVEEKQEEIDIPQIAEQKVSTDEVAKATSDLDAIAATLLAEYQKEESPEIALPKADNEETPVNTNEQFSSVFVTPDTLPNVEEEKEVVPAMEMPNLTDIPVPQPVRVVSQSTIIDSSKQNENVDINNINNEEYQIKK